MRGLALIHLVLVLLLSLLSDFRAAVSVAGLTDLFVPLRSVGPSGAARIGARTLGLVLACLAGLNVGECLDQMTIPSSFRVGVSGAAVYIRARAHDSDVSAFAHVVRLE